jgi:hypothetical protein
MSLLSFARLAAAHLEGNRSVRLNHMINIAEANPGLAYVQDFAAREAWRQGDVSLARKLAQRAITLDTDSLAPLRILAEVSADGDDEGQTYQYAKRLLGATRIDKQAEPWIRLAAAPFWLIPKYRKRVRDFLQNYVPQNDEWVHWAREYVDWYESQSATPRANP